MNQGQFILAHLPALLNKSAEEAIEYNLRGIETMKVTFHLGSPVTQQQFNSKSHSATVEITKEAAKNYYTFTTPREFWVLGRTLVESDGLRLVD